MMRTTFPTTTRPAITLPSTLPATLVLATAFLAVAGAPTPAAGQAVVGHVVAADTDAPLAGVFVTLVANGEQAAGFLSRPDGSFLIRAPGPGTYVLRAEMIGYADVDVTVELEAGATVQRTFRLPLRALELEGLVASATRERDCALRPEEGDALSRLWETARQGLRIAEWSEESGWLRASGRTYQRLLDLVDHEILAQTVQRRRSVEPRAFAAAHPDDVLWDGFVRPTGDGGAVYHGADAALLLSDGFMETHCFRLAERPDQGLVGLAFEPVDGRAVTDIEGTLWLDAETAQLRRLEYEYTDYPIAAPLPRSRFGGLTEFRHLPGGSVAVERWRIRMPALLDWADPGAMRSVRRCGMDACDDGETLRELSRAGLAVEEEGGRVIEFRMTDGTTLPATNRAAITGLVVDSTVSGGPWPLSGAEVTVVGTEHRAVTDARGRFRFDNLAEGRYRLVFDHPRLRQEAIRSPAAVVVDAESGDVAEARLAVPSAATIAMLRCRAERTEAGEPVDRRRPDAGPDGPEGARVVFGAVTDASTGAPVAGASVHLGWPAGGGATGARVDSVVLATEETDLAGRFLFCDVPEGPLELAADFLGAGERALQVEPRPGTALHVDVELTMSTAGRLRGRVVRADDGRPVDGALVRILETGQQRATNAAGAFVIDSVPAGAVMVQVEHVAYASVTGAVAIHGGETVGVELRVADQVITMDPLVITARGRPLTAPERMGGFYVRRQRGSGHYYDREDFESRAGARTTDFLADAGLIMNRTATGTVIRSQRRPGSLQIGGTDNPLCSPMIYLDGVLITARTAESGSAGVTAAAAALETLKHIGDLVNSIPISQLAGIEVYPGPSSVPGEFAGPRTDCGVVLIWTGVSDRGAKAPVPGRSPRDLASAPVRAPEPDPGRVSRPEPASASDPAATPDPAADPAGDTVATPRPLGDPGVPAIGTPAPTTGQIVGRVVRAGDGMPVAGAVVRITGNGVEQTTNAAGRFVFDSVGPGAVVLGTDHVAYQGTRGTVHVDPGERVELELRVAEQVFELEPLVVTARSRPLLMEERMGGFYIRKQRGLGGTYLDAEDIAARPAMNLTELVVDGTGMGTVKVGTTVMWQGRRPMSLGGGAAVENPYCTPVIYLDGTKLTVGGDGAAAMEIVNEIPLSQLAGVEVYPGASSVPGELAGLNTDCGVVAVWTKSRDRTRRLEDGGR